jgi:hypothetical protein
MWPLKTILFFGMFWGACLMALANPIWGVVNYLMVYQIHPKNTWWGVPLDKLHIRFSLLACAFTMIGFVTGRKRVPRIKPGYSMWEVGLVLLVATAALNLVIGLGYNRGSAYAFEKLWKMSLFVLILGRLATTRTNLKMVIWTFVAGSFYVGYDAYTAGPSAFWMGRLELIGGPDFANTSGTAAHLSAMLPIIGVAFLIAKRWRGRIFAAVAGALAFNTIIMCRTRSAFVGLVCGACAALLAVPRPKRFRLRLLLVTTALLAFSLTDAHFWERMGTLADKDVLSVDAATVARKQIWLVSLRIIADHPQGIGTGNFPWVVGTYDSRYFSRSSHNTLVVCFTELGVHGGLLFLLLVAGSVRALYLSYKLANDTERPAETRLLAYGLFVALVTYFVAGLGTERFYCESFWWILVLPQCLYRTVVREVTAEQLVPELGRSRRWFAGSPALLPGY